MRYYLDFINAKEIQKSQIFSSLKCDEDEAKILQYMAKALLNSEVEVMVLSLIENLFGLKGEATLTYLPKIKNLLELGWISQSNFSRPTNTLLLELLNENIYLTHSFLRLLEDGTLEVKLPQAYPYQDHLEYLKDQFLKIDLIQQINHLKLSYKLDSPSLSRIQYRLSTLEQQIKYRLKLTQTPLEIVSLIKEAELSNKEQTLFFALLKEEYSGGEGNLREMNALIELISEDEYDKIKNRSLLDEKSNLIEKNLVDYDEILNPFGGIARTFFINEEILQKIIYPNKKKKKSKNTLTNLIKEQETFEILEPKKDLQDIVLSPSTRETLEALLKQMDPKVLSQLKAWGIKEKKSGIESKIIFYGSAGTGKTLTALALAKSLKKQILNFDCSKILSMYVGESEKNVRKIFDSYREIAQKSKSEPILLLDEADQFLSSRSTGGSGADKMHNQMQNIFLEQIEKFDGILIATTNLLETLDSAFSRRFNYKIEFKRPSKEQRKELWKLHLPKNANFKEDEETLLEKLSSFDLSGGQIALVVKNTAYKVATREDNTFCLKDFKQEITRERDGSFDGEKSMGFLI